MCDWFDETCGALLEHLEKKGLAENTLVVYLCDNGWIQNPQGGNYAPRSKRSPYDGGLRTPIMVRWPGHIKPRMSDELAMSIDLAPTILTAVGLKPTPQMQGVNLLDDKAVKERKTIFGEVFTHNAVDIDKPASSLQFRWIVDGNWKLIVPAPWNEPKAPVELFDVGRDPWEKEDLAAKDPEKATELRKKLDEWWAPKNE
jgi:uncharacterized sulfatase